MGQELCPQEHSIMETLPNKLKSPKSRSPSNDWAFIVLDFRSFLNGLLDSFFVFLTNSSCKEYFFLLSPLLFSVWKTWIKVWKNKEIFRNFPPLGLPRYRSLHSWNIRGGRVCCTAGWRSLSHMTCVFLSQLSQF